jgi:ribonuclease HII
VTDRCGPSWELEEQLFGQGHDRVIGIDEAGRGALAGPVTAAAVMLPAGSHPFRDSKTLSRPARQKLAEQLETTCIAAATGWATAGEVDELGVLRATHLAAARALGELGSFADGAALVTDYLRLAWNGPVLSVARADARSYQVAAASILAKVERDRYMNALAGTWPHYGFETNSGYGTAAHLLALQEHGVTPAHRVTFRPVAEAAAQAAASTHGPGLEQ